MDFFNFLETQATAELAHRRELEVAEKQADATTVNTGKLSYIEGQLAALNNQSPYAMPLLIGGALLAAYLIFRK